MTFFATKVSIVNEFKRYQMLGTNWDMLGFDDWGSHCYLVPGPDGKFGYGGRFLKMLML